MQIKTYLCTCGYAVLFASQLQHTMPQTQFSKTSVIHFYFCWPVYGTVAFCLAVHSVFWGEGLTPDGWQIYTGGHAQKQKENFTLVVNMKIFQGHGELTEERE